jgi:hypothetical protein
MVAMVHSFLLALLEEVQEPLKKWLLAHYCHRTGKK